MRCRKEAYRIFYTARAIPDRIQGKLLTFTGASSQHSRNRFNSRGKNNALDAFLCFAVSRSPPTYHRSNLKSPPTPICFRGVRRAALVSRSRKIQSNTVESGQYSVASSREPHGL